MDYDFKSIESKWQEHWASHKTFQVKEDPSKPKYYVLDMFPYPSGAGLHVGHPLGYIASDIFSRYKRLKGFNVLHPMGYDAFGLPAEQYAIQTGQHPEVTTTTNIARYRQQLDRIGFSYDWDREVRTCDPGFYKWTQWAFLKMFESWYDPAMNKARPISELVARIEREGYEDITPEIWKAASEKEKSDFLMRYRIAYQGETSVNWCEGLGTVLANDEVKDGLSVRGGFPVEQKKMTQWQLRVSAYAGRLLDSLDKLDWTDSLKEMQRNWIGRSEGTEMVFNTICGDREMPVTIFTTRVDTIYGVTFMVLAPESDLVDQLTTPGQRAAVDEYIKYVKTKTERERIAETKTVTGVFSGSYGINPVTGDKVPIWISEYVLAGYGTGAIMAVPAHDGRDWDFAKAFDLPIIEVVAGGDVEKEAFTLKDDTGIMINSGFLNGLTVKQAIPTMINWLHEHDIGEEKVNYKLRDWVFSRQRYWGEPIPMIECPDCGWVPVPEEELPLVLPEVESYEPTDDGESPLAKMTDWVNTTCPKCGGPAKRETDTMPNWAGSSWYFLRYTDADNKAALASREALDYWTPVDWYNGGMEHTTLHLLYSRFWHKFLYDIGVVPTKEPYMKRTSHGMILGEGGIKMSKSRGNVVNPNDIVDEYGADTLRLYIMFIGDFEKACSWETKAVSGCKRFLDRVWNLQDKLEDGDGISEKNEGLVHKTIKKVGSDIENLKMNTAIAALMTMVNEFYEKGLSKGDFEQLLLLLSPFAPHLVEEMWEQSGFAAATGKMAMQNDWPLWDDAKTIDATVEMAIQVCGKLRGTVVVPIDSDQDTVVAAAMQVPKIAKMAEGKNLFKVIHIKNKLVNLILK